jgi:hypothetical protein
MAKAGVSELLLHNFPENGVKFLLHNPGNLRDLLTMLAKLYPDLPGPDRFAVQRRDIQPDTFIRGDFSHGVADLLVRLPFRTDEREEWIQIYLLVEHLSTHQRLIVPRSVGYAMDAYRSQLRRWEESRGSLEHFKYDLVVPIVLYTGERSWRAPTPFRNLVNGGDAFPTQIPSIEPLFLSLPSLNEETLAREGGALGVVLRLLRQRSAAFETFQALLTDTALMVESQLWQDSHRLREILSYLAASVYHFRNKNEREHLSAELARSIQSRTLRREVQTMGQTIADALREEGKREGRREGKLEGKQQALVLQMQRRFGRKATAAFIATIEKTTAAQTLDKWLGNIVDAKTVEDIGIPTNK